MSQVISSASLSRAFTHLAMLPLGLGWGMHSAHADPKMEYRAVYQSAEAAAGYGTGKFGRALFSEVGAETSGVKTFDGRRLVLQWDANGGARGGYAGNEHPGRIFVGGRANLGGELGLRLMPSSSWSPYVGSGFRIGGTALTIPSIPPGVHDNTNSFDGIAGLTGSASGRVATGVSYINGRHAVNVTGFVQETLRTPANASAGGAFTELGVHAQYDLSDKLRLLFEASYGKTGQRSEPVFSSTTQATHVEVATGVRATLYKSFWMGLDARISDEHNKTTYASSPIVYQTADQPVPSVMLSAGVALP